MHNSTREIDFTFESLRMKSGDAAYHHSPETKNAQRERGRCRRRCPTLCCCLSRTSQNPREAIAWENLQSHRPDSSVVLYRLLCAFAIVFRYMSYALCGPSLALQISSTPVDSYNLLVLHCSFATFPPPANRDTNCTRINDILVLSKPSI
nr:hypothetical protein Iba_chr12bCG24660 [Ipomoea batatas]